ncbi:MAG: hypothetical protein KY452_06750, partial [Actinobacteria bacterium]|nr:hypothetical protein [Actinomycetota bacterium]
CAEPGCLDGCPVDAYEKDPVTGVVRHLDDQCIGCSYCTLTCPYEVPQYDAGRGIVRKCDMCHDRLAEGEAPPCVRACPTEAITESKMFEFSFTNRNDAIYTRSELLVDDDGRPQKLPWEDWREGDDEHTSAWMRATSPNGSAAYEGRISWSGELGYGVRPAEAGQSAEPDLAPPKDLEARVDSRYGDDDTAVGERASDYEPAGPRASGGKGDSA